MTIKLPPYSPKQKQFIQEANAKYNLAHGAVSSGKTVCTLVAFLKEAAVCPGDSIAIFGFSMGSIYQNVITLIFNAPELAFVRPSCTWSSKGVLAYGLKSILCIGAGDEGALGKIQGITLDLCLCDEMTLYPDVVIDMIQTRLRRAHSKLFAAMNPKQPSHRLKQWIDRAETDPNYYALHFSIEDNRMFLAPGYIEDMQKSLSGLFYKRNYLGIWCLAEGAVYDFFDPKLHVVSRPPRCAEYWIAAIDYGTLAPFCCLVIGVSTGRYDQTGRKWWVEKEYYWNPAVTHKQKTNAEFAQDVQKFIEPYALRGLYVDPSCAAFKLDLQKLGIHCVDANNDVANGIQIVASEMYKGNLVILDCCTNLIKEIEGYVWDSKKAEKGYDEPMKGSGILDHACFCADTFIAGSGNIEGIKEGNLVFTRGGLRKVRALGESASVECFEFHLANRPIKCTPNHPFYTVDNGWKMASDLIQSDILITMKDGEKWANMAKLSSYFSEEENTDDIQMLLKNLRDCTTSVDLLTCIEMCGAPPMGQYQRDIISITSTKTHLIMIYPISNVFLQKSMNKDIEKIVHTAFRTLAGIELLSGINQIKEESGTKNTLAGSPLETGRPENLFVKTVGGSTGQKKDPIQKTAFVQINVSLPGGVILELTMSLENVLDVIGSSLLINIEKPNTALEPVLRRPIGWRKVYNLSVDKESEYFADGLLVHNCDALRYGISSHRVNTMPESDGKTLGGGGFRKI